MSWLQNEAFFFGPTMYLASCKTKIMKCMGYNNKQLTFPLQLKTNCCALKIKSSTASSKAGDKLSKAPGCSFRNYLKKWHKNTLCYIWSDLFGELTLLHYLFGGVTLREHASEKIKCVKQISALRSACKAIMETCTMPTKKSITPFFPCLQTLHLIRAGVAFEDLSYSLVHKPNNKAAPGDKSPGGSE